MNDACVQLSTIGANNCGTNAQLIWPRKLGVAAVHLNM